jgi:hypothetical protein
MGGGGGGVWVVGLRVCGFVGYFKVDGWADGCDVSVMIAPERNNIYRRQE